MPFNEALFWVGITVLGTGGFIIWERHLKSWRWSVFLLLSGVFAVGYSVYLQYHPKAPNPPLWTLLVANWIALAYLYGRRTRASQRVEPPLSEIPAAEQKVAQQKLPLGPLVPPNAAELVWNWRRMVTNAHNIAREENISFPEALIRDPSFPDLRPHLRESVRNAIEGVHIWRLPQGTLTPMDPLFNAVLEDVDRTAKQWGLPTEPLGVRPTDLPSSKAPSAFAVFMEETEFLLRVYRRLSFDDPADTRLPLNPASWPNFNPPQIWTYTQIQMCCLSGRFDLLVLLAKQGLKDAGSDEKFELLDLNRESTVMVELLPALEQFRDAMKAKAGMAS